ncbi:MAG: 1-acyl-sn-glycerol-3-phosphate acyltransferase, partial [Gammaproteobacteria bacterium]|nr:1-acyl-sn-glycerol-3-phosphate acyltransferase [Gammaproteobacteria bacterium]
MMSEQLQSKDIFSVNKSLEPKSRQAIYYFKLTSCLILISLGSLIILSISTISLFQLRRLYTEVLTRWLAWTILQIFGIHICVHNQPHEQHSQVIYISNHSSTLDIFILLALGLPNTRYFLAGFLKKFIPIGIIGCVIGNIWTKPQTQPIKRIKIFTDAEKKIRSTGTSVYLSPEGRRVVNGEIGHFNKGAFHLATNLKIAIVPIYIDIPNDVNPGLGSNAKPGIVNVHYYPPISTCDWKIEHLNENRNQV